MSYSFPSREKVDILICAYAYATSFQGVCAHAFAYVRMCVRVPVHMCARAYTYVFMLYARKHAREYVYVRMHVCTCVRAYVCA